MKAIQYKKLDDLPRVWLLIPIETKAREYHAKLLLSCVAAEKGFGVILGHKGALATNLRFLPRGIIFGNNITTEIEGRFARYRDMGYTVAAWCEEGIAYRNRQSYRHERVSAEAMARAAVFFAWGDYHAEDVRRAIEVDDLKKVIPSGSPRLDLLRPRFREFYREAARRIGERYGRIVLVNTNFHRFNHFLGRGAYLQGLKDRGKVPNAEKEVFFREWIAFLGEMYNAFAKMLGPLSAALPDHAIILRPHPSENHDAWKKEVKGLSNVKVLHEGGALPWILASEVVIHNSCATGIEAFGMGVPVVSYRPMTSERYDSFLPNAVSREVFSEQDLVGMVKALVSSELGRGSEAELEKKRLAQRFFSGLEGRLASEIMVDRLGSLDVCPVPFASTPVHALARKMAFRGILPAWVFLQKLVRGGDPHSTYLHQKFPSLGLSEVKADLNRLQKVSGRFANVGVTEICESLFYVTSRAGEGLSSG
jgi:surface carbohydrate biosynthesis protein